MIVMVVGSTAPEATLARFVATVPFRVGRQAFGVVVTPDEGEQEEAKQTFDGFGVWSHAPDPLQVPPHAPTAHEVPLGAGGLLHPATPPSPTVHVPGR
jgi:hypothetical protein